uniref:Branched-chain amino acid transport system permease protein n=2 Tax=Candidatus Kentrum sp. MB TaxID=2138164 RepID=A0A450X302_9GAMM|nr:MAG: branched-chain amino acid transport system permease protein [Candidatus Kentron sp. MB]VFK28008.1 MAG: branched-chain amino acid transport system permease protein [Candidatus Kentron sp. MB]
MTILTKILGITNIPDVGWLPNRLVFMGFAILIAGLFYFLLWRLSRSSWVLNLRGIRDDEVLMQAMGKSVKKIKIVTFTVSAMIASTAGVLYAHYTSYIDPTSFTIHESIYILAIVIIGGLGNLHGVFFSAVLMVLLPEILRFIGLPDSIGANVR